MGERLGKAEEEALSYAYRQKDSVVDYVSRSGAILAYYFRNIGQSNHHWSKNVRRQIPEERYNSLQSLISRALRRLEEKGYVEILRLKYNSKGHISEDGNLVYAKNWRGWYRVCYRLTKKGRQKARFSNEYKR